MVARTVGCLLLVLALGVLGARAGEDKNIKGAKREGAQGKDALVQPKKDTPKDTKKDGAKETTPAKKGVEGKVKAIDKAKGSFTVSAEAGKDRTFQVTENTKFYGPRGGNRGLGKEGLKDDAFTVGAVVRVVAGTDAKTAAEVHLPTRKTETKVPPKDAKDKK